VTKWIEKPTVLAIHDRQIAEYGGSDTILHADKLEAVLERPKNLEAFGSPKPDLAQLAAALAHGIACGHAFLDGNHRTSCAVTEAFLNANGFALEASDEELQKTWTDLGNQTLSEQELADWIRQRLVALGEEAPPDSA
jgi:death-on-curing protein